MTISSYDNNCSMVAFQQILPDRDERDIIEACLSSGFTEWLGMLPHQIEQAAEKLGLQYTKADLLQYKPSIKHNDSRTSLTLNQALAATSTEVCLIRVTGHVLASNHGIPLDPNMKRRGARRRVLGLYVMHNATIPRRESRAITRDPEIQFVHDVRHDTRATSSRRAMYDRIYSFLGDPAMPVRLSKLKQFGYDRKLFRRHLERGDIIITEE